jgi:hypothetical protein
MAAQEETDQISNELQTSLTVVIFESLVVDLVSLRFKWLVQESRIKSATEENDLLGSTCL